MTAVLAAAASATVGAPCRYPVDWAVQARQGYRFPVGTLLINLLGSFLLGFLTTKLQSG
jgi:CrcB protein